MMMGMKLSSLKEYPKDGGNMKYIFAIFLFQELSLQCHRRFLYDRYCLLSTTSALRKLYRFLIMSIRPPNILDADCKTYIN